MRSDAEKTTEALVAYMLNILPPTIVGREADAVVIKGLELIDDYIDARIAEALDREFNRGAWARY